MPGSTSALSTWKQLRLDFALIAGHPALTARVVFRDAQYDIAGLEQAGPPPSEAKPTRLVTAEELWQHRYRVWPRGCRGGSYMLAPMDREELREAMLQLVARFSVTFEPGLAELILDQVEGRPGQLPLLEFALTLLWEDQASGRLTPVAYQPIGGPRRSPITPLRLWPT